MNGMYEKEILVRSTSGWFGRSNMALVVMDRGEPSCIE